MLANLEQLGERAEMVYDDLNINHRDMLRCAVYVIRGKARACMSVEGGLFENWKV